MNAAGEMHHGLEAKGHNITIFEVLILSELSLLRPLTSDGCNNKLLDFSPVNFPKNASENVKLHKIFPCLVTDQNCKLQIFFRNICSYSTMQVFLTKREDWNAQNAARPLAQCWMSSLSSRLLISLPLQRFAKTLFCYAASEIFYGTKNSTWLLEESFTLVLLVGAVRCWNSDFILGADLIDFLVSFFFFFFIFDFT